MNAIKKTILCIASILIVMLILPVLFIHLVSGDSGMGLCFLLFFIVDPALCLVLGITAGTDIRKLWWIPLASSLAFPFLFSLAVTEMVWDLFFYSAIYFGIGVLAMLGSFSGIKLVNKKKSNRKETL